jgi:hypothetical protein
MSIYNRQQKREPAKIRWLPSTSKLTARTAVAFDTKAPNLGCDQKTDSANPQEKQYLANAKFAAQALEGDGGCHRDGDDEGDDDPQPDGIDGHRIAARVEQGLQDGDVVVELGEPERQRDEHDPQAVDDDRSRNGQQDEGQDAERGGDIPRPC